MDRSRCKSKANFSLTGKVVYLVMAYGGVQIGSEMDLASRYMKQVLGLIGLNDVRIIDAAKLDIENKDENLLEENIND